MKFWIILDSQQRFFPSNLQSYWQQIRSASVNRRKDSLFYKSHQLGWINHCSPPHAVFSECHMGRNERSTW